MQVTTIGHHPHLSTLSLPDIIACDSPFVVEVIKTGRWQRPWNDRGYICHFHVRNYCVLRRDHVTHGSISSVLTVIGEDACP